MALNTTNLGFMAMLSEGKLVANADSATNTENVVTISPSSGWRVLLDKVVVNYSPGFTGTQRITISLTQNSGARSIKPNVESIGTVIDLGVIGDAGQDVTITAPAEALRTSHISALYRLVN